MPRVSVIIPNYNHAVFLEQRIDSVLNQTYSDFEVIILDDCSTDNSKEIIERYRSNKKISHIVYNIENGGNPFQQWNKGTELANGEYIWIAESDDWCEPVLLETIMSGLEKNDNCILGYCQSYCVTDGNKIKFQSGHSSLEEYIDGKKFITEYILPRNPVFNASMAVWKKDCYTKMSRNYINYKVMGDYYFWIELCTRGDVFICGKLLNYFRTHEKNVSVISFNNGKMYLEKMPLLKNLFERNIIDGKNYLRTMNETYAQFLLNEKDMSQDSAQAIRNLFSSYGINEPQIPFKKRIKSFAKKTLKL